MEKVAQWLEGDPEELLRLGKYPKGLEPQACNVILPIKLGMSTVELVRILTIGQLAISLSIQRVEKVAKTEESVYQFIENMKS